MKNDNMIPNYHGENTRQIKLECLRLALAMAGDNDSPERILIIAERVATAILGYKPFTVVQEPETSVTEIAA